MSGIDALLFFAQIALVLRAFHVLRSLPSLARQHSHVFSSREVKAPYVQSARRASQADETRTLRLHPDTISGPNTDSSTNDINPPTSRLSEETQTIDIPHDRQHSTSIDVDKAARALRSPPWLSPLLNRIAAPVATIDRDANAHTRDIASSRRQLFQDSFVRSGSLLELGQEVHALVSPVRMARGNVQRAVSPGTCQNSVADCNNPHSFVIDGFRIVEDMPLCVIAEYNAMSQEAAASEHSHERTRHRAHCVEPCRTKQPAMRPPHPRAVNPRIDQRRTSSAVIAGTMLLANATATVAHNLAWVGAAQFRSLLGMFAGKTSSSHNNTQATQIRDRRRGDQRSRHGQHSSFGGAADLYSRRGGALQLLYWYNAAVVACCLMLGLIALSVEASRSLHAMCSPRVAQLYDGSSTITDSSSSLSCRTTLESPLHSSLESETVLHTVGDINSSCIRDGRIQCIWSEHADSYALRVRVDDCNMQECAATGATWSAAGVQYPVTKMHAALAGVPQPETTPHDSLALAGVTSITDSDSAGRCKSVSIPVQQCALACPSVRRNFESDSYAESAREPPPPAPHAAPAESLAGSGCENATPASLSGTMLAARACSMYSCLHDGLYCHWQWVLSWLTYTADPRSASSTTSFSTSSTKVTDAYASAPPLLWPALFWLRTLYGLSAAPYILFKIPLFARLYLTPHATGYDRKGRTVLQRLGPRSTVQIEV